MKKQFSKYLLILAMLLLIAVQTSFAQTALVIGAFNNKSDELYLDSWQRSVPEIIRSYLSTQKDIRVLERDNVGSVLQEKALSMSGLTETTTDSLDKLSAADFILTGNIDHQDNKIVITADLVRIKTGQVITERVLAADRTYKQAMVTMLVDNILFRLNNQGSYQSSKIIPSNAFWYWAASAVALGGGALVSRTVYLDNYKKYHKTDQLEKFDGYYDKANAANKTAIALFVLSVGAASGALATWIRQKNTQTISAGHAARVTFVPEIKWNHEKKIILGLSLHF